MQKITLFFVSALFAAAFLLPNALLAQRGGSATVMENLRDFDYKKYHFGFALGFNSSSHWIDKKQGTFFSDSLLGINPRRRPGLNIGLVSQLKITNGVSLRFTPTLSFQEREIEYRFLDNQNRTTFFNKTVESTMVEFPLLVKLRTKRINNFASYVIAGPRVAIDMSSTEDVIAIRDEDVILKTRRLDYGGEIGAGMDFFLPYFKFGIELKMSFGVRNMIIAEPHRFSDPIQRALNQSWMLSFTFEG
ncbi:MAG: type IX secretion/gliding motility protein PorT/SprT [Luteibaculaceae bacterium]